MRNFWTIPRYNKYLCTYKKNKHLKDATALFFGYINILYYNTNEKTNKNSFQYNFVIFVICLFLAKCGVSVDLMI